MNMKKRIFIGISLPLSIKENLQKDLETIPGRIVPPENWHYTLQFLPLRDDSELEHLKFILSSLNLGAPIAATLKNLGAFPNENDAKLLWIGLNKGAKELSILAKKITEALMEENFKLDMRPYIPHLTIRRFFPPRNVFDIIQNIQIKEYAFLIEEIILYQSILEEASSHYVHLASYQLH